MRSTVRVTFLDETTGAILGEVELTATRLPQSFSPATILHLGDDDWLVVSADPPEADAYLAQGRLQLKLRHTPRRPQESLAPRSSLFSYPTLADPLPAMGEARPADGVLELAQDEWRQIELVAASTADAVAHEIAAVERVVRDTESSGGYRQAHARTALPEPLPDIALDLESLRALFPRIERTYTAVAFQGFDRAIDGGFAFRTAGGLLVYGLVREGRVRVLGLRPDRSRNGPPLDAGSITRLRREHGLLLVDWCARAVVRAPAATPAASSAS